MVGPRLRRLGMRGFSAVELMVVVGIIGILAAIGIPSLFTYLRAARLTAGALEVKTLLNVARQEAIRRNDSICVEYLNQQIRLRQATCGGTVVTLPGTDANGWFPLANGIDLSGATANVVFTYLGAASTPGQLTVRNQTNAQTATVTVASSGRITIP